MINQKLTALIFLIFFLSIITLQSNAQTSTQDKSPLPIILDKSVYTWTDKVYIKIIAPSWNKNPNLIETLGDKDNALIKIATREAELKPYALIETESNSGEFVGMVTLTGFLHDVDGDKKIDTDPKVSGSGPFDGFLPAKRGDGITVNFETNKKVYSSASAPIRWNVGELVLDKESYFIDDKIKILVNDPDMNLNPNAMDKLTITASSEADPSGFRISAEETKVDSGIFQATVLLSIKKPTPTGTLYVLPPDTISIKYKDRTLPSPDSISDAKTIEKKVSFKDPTPSTSRIDVSNTYLKNNIGIPKIEPQVGRQVEVTSSVENKQNYEQKFVYLVQIINDEGRIVKLSWLEGVLNPYQTLVIGKQWIPEKAGNYIVETYVWNSLKFPIALSPKISNNYQVVE